MEILILNALQRKTKDYEKTRSFLEKIFQNNKYRFEWINVREMDVNFCIGTKCLDCQFKTPGLCKQKDDMQSLYPKLINANLLIFLTPISFGSYHSELKKIIDRFLPLDIPVYTIYQDELHHKSRYEEMPNLFSIGFLKDESQESIRIFTELTKRNALNMLIEKFVSEIIKKDDDLVELEDKIIDKLKELV
jgi:hypothetical protein